MTLQPAYYLPQPVVNHEQKVSSPKAFYSFCLFGIANTGSQRLNMQHQVLKMTLGGLYPAGAAELVKRALVPEPGRKRAILDVGTGTGAWYVHLFPIITPPCPSSCPIQYNIIIITRTLTLTGPTDRGLTSTN